MKALSIKLLDILAEVRRGAFTIPQFQREFVWEPAATCKLIDSIARGYPIGALLTLPCEALALPSQPLDFEGAAAVTEGMQSFYLLDGQQRLTSIARAMLAADRTLAYYFDLEAMYDELVLESGSDMPWVVNRKKTKKDSGRTVRAGTENKNQLLPCYNAMESSLVTAQVLSFLQEKHPEDDIVKLVGSAGMQKLTTVLEVVRNYQIIMHQMEHNEQLEAICRIFETINNTGVCLDTFDLVVAKTYSPEYNLREKLEDAKAKYPSARTVTGESFLHAILYATQMLDKKRPSLTRAALLDTDARLWTEGLDKAARAFDAVNQWLYQNRLGRIELVPLALQEVLATVEMLNPGVIAQHQVSVRLKKWLLATLWTVDSYNKSNSVADLLLLNDFFERASAGAGASLHFLEAPLIPAISAADVFNYSPGCRNYKVLQAIIMSYAVKDIFGADIDDLRGLEDHHIMPRTLCDKLGVKKRIRDSMANRVLVAPSTNNRLVRDQIPENYFEDAKRLLGAGEAQRLFDTALISEPFLKKASELTEPTLMAALSLRAELIAARANDYFGVTPAAKATAEETFT